MSGAIRWLTFIFAASLSGCLVGPDYERPELGIPEEFSQPTVGGLSSDAADLNEWWTRLGDRQLDALIERAVEGNLDVRAASARVRQARAERGISRSGLLPSIGTGASYSRERSSENLSGTTTQAENLYEGSFDAAWELDVFGGVRRGIEASQAELEATEADLRDVLVTLTAEVALNYVELRSAQRRLAVARGNLQIQRDSVAQARSRYEAGLATGLDIAEAELNVETTAAELPALEEALTQTMHRVDVLVGRPPGTTRSEFAEPKPIPVAPTEIAVGVPAEALRRRPDVRSAERALAAQSARVGVATAELYPKFQLNGTIGLSARDAAAFFSAGSTAASFGPQITWRLFEGGAIRQAIEVEDALQEQALIQYEAVILGAMEEVENAMNAYVQDQLRRRSLMRAEARAVEAAETSLSLYELGLDRFDRVLEAQATLLQVQDELVLSDAEVTSDVIALYKSLGGGW